MVAAKEKEEEEKSKTEVPKEPVVEAATSPVNSLQKQKKSLFLPDLVPNVVIPQPPLPVTESESDEYQSADEQPLHGNPGFPAKIARKKHSVISLHLSASFRYALSGLDS